MSQPQIPQPTYSRFEVVNDTPADDSSLPEAVPVQQPYIQGQNVQYLPQQNAYPQIPQTYYMPVQGPNGLIYMPVNNQPYPVQQPSFIPQGYPQLPAQPYGFPQYQQQPQQQEPSYYERITAYFGSLDAAGKYRLGLRIFSVITVIALILTIRCMFKGYHGHGKILGLINIILTLVSVRKGICGLTKKSKRAFKGHLKMMGMVFILTIYNALVFICMAGFRHIGGVFALLALAGVEGWVLCKGKRLWKNQLKAEWAGLQDPCAGGWCCRNRAQC